MAWALLQRDPMAKDEQGTEGGRSKVVSLATARELRAANHKARRRALVDPEAFDLDELDVERMSTEAKEAFRLRVERYAQRLLRSSANFSEADGESDEAAIDLKHIKAASRLPSLASGSKQAQFGMGFLLDASLIVSAATVGALCADPTILGSGGYALLAIAVAVTVGAFVAKENFQSK